MNGVLQRIIGAGAPPVIQPRNISMGQDTLAQRSPFASPSIFREVPHAQITDEECERLAFLHRHAETPHLNEAHARLNAFMDDGDLQHLARVQALISHLIDLEIAKA